MSPSNSSYISTRHIFHWRKSIGDWCAFSTVASACRIAMVNLEQASIPSTTVTALLGGTVATWESRNGL